MKTIYLHIGTHKTGTTYLQNYLSYNKSRLRDDGLYYVTDSQGVCAHGIAVAMGFWEDHCETHVEDKEWFRAEMRTAMASTAHSILLSSEVFCETSVARRLKLIRRLHAELTSFGADRIIVICYLRRQDLFIESRHANDIVYWGITPPVSQADPETAAYADYYKLLSDYRAIFGNNLVIRPYEKGQLLKGDILDDLFEQIGVFRNPRYALPTGDDQNVRTRGDLTEMVRLYNLSGLAKTRHYSFVKALFTPEQRGSGPGARFLTLDKKKRADILKRYAPSNRKVAIEFLGRKSGKLFRDQIEPKPNHEPRGAGLQIEEITPLFMHMITELFDQAQPWPARIKALEKKSAHLEAHLEDRFAVMESRLQGAADRYGELESELRRTQDRLQVAARELEWRLACLSIADKQLVGWGTTVAFREHHFTNPAPLSYLIDNNSAKWGKKLKGIPIYNPGKLEKAIPSKVIVIVYSCYFDEIAAQIARMGDFTVMPADIFGRYAPSVPIPAANVAELSLVSR